MSKEVIIAKGLFSKIAVTLNDDVMQTLAMTQKEDNPLAQVEEEMKAVLSKFERLYFELTYPATPTSTTEGE